MDPAVTLSSDRSAIILGQTSAKRHICFIMCLPTVKLNWWIACHFPELQGPQRADEV